MGRGKEETSAFTHAELVRYSKRLRAVADAIDDLDLLAIDAGLDAVYAFRRKSLDRGIKQVESFASDLRVASAKIASGTPLRADTDKSDL